MQFEKIDKTILLLLTVVLMALVGGHIRRQNYNPEQELSGRELNKIISVDVYGEVNKPGKVYVTKGSRACDAIYEAGGITEYADVSKIDIYSVLNDNTRLHVPRIYSSSEDGIPKININTADADELIILPGIGEKTAGNIIDYRKENGEFQTPEDIMNVKGIGIKTYEKIKNYIITEETEK